VVAATCEVARMLTGRLGLGPDVSQLVEFEDERWDGKDLPACVGGDEIPLPVRIVHVARDAAFQRLLGDREYVAEVIGQRAGAAFDPTIARLVAEDPHLVELGSEPSAWERVLASEPEPWLVLEGEAIDPALAAMGHFSDINVPHTVGHSGGVAALAAAGGQVVGFGVGEQAAVHRAALVHDLGRVAVPSRIWTKTDPLTADDWEQIRLLAYQSERVLARSPFLAELATIAGAHHERTDGSGYHRGATAATLDPPARLLAAADAYHAMTEPRPHRRALPPGDAAAALAADARAGRLAPEAVTAVLEAAGQTSSSIARPAGLTEREVDVVRLLARGLQTRQVARALGISAKTADHHVQNSYRKMGVSTRAGATLFAMQRGLTTPGELPMESRP
jgi:HD-GYP domain-containing protein (c-di-GMP phosphodiesterase class II)